MLPVDERVFFSNKTNYQLFKVNLMYHGSFLDGVLFPIRDTKIDNLSSC